MARSTKQELDYMASRPAYVKKWVRKSANKWLKKTGRRAKTPSGWF